MGKVLTILTQPSAFVIIGLFAELAVLVGARFWPLQVRRRHLLIGPILIVLGLGLDYLVATDREKIETIIATVVQATQEEQAEDIIRFISPDYADSFHHSRESFAAFCRQIFSQPQIEKNWLTNKELKIRKTEATVWITAVTKLDERNQWTAGLSVIKTTWRLEFSRQPDKSWLITTIELIELGDELVDWKVSK